MLVEADTISPDVIRPAPREIAIPTAMVTLFARADAGASVDSGLMAKEAAGRAYSIRQLAKAAGCPVRTIHSWVLSGLLPAPTSRGPGARYDERYLLRLRAVKALRSELSAAKVRARLEGATDDDLRAILGLEPKNAPLDPEKATLRLPAPSYVAPRWERIELVPGLELSVKEGSPALRRLAQQIVDAFAPRVSL